jgi:mannosylglucosylglycerate synthase
MANGQSTVAAHARQIKQDGPSLPRIIILHYTAPPIVGGVEAVMAEQGRLFRQAGFPVLMVAGRQDSARQSVADDVLIIPGIDSESPEYLNLKPSIDAGKPSPEFSELQGRIEQALIQELQPTDIVIVHNALSTHFNLVLTAALLHLQELGSIQHMIAWCHDVSRYINPDSGVAQRSGFPWDSLRTRAPAITYVAVSHRRQRLLAQVLRCAPELIQVIPNGVNPAQLLGLSALGNELAEEWGLLDADLVILMPVRITRAKNIEFAVRVADFLKKAGIDLRLIVTGPPDPHVPEIRDLYEDLNQLRQSLNLSRDVIFAYDGTEKHKSPLVLEPSVVGELYRLSDLILMPSLREGFGLPVLEAGMASHPVFATHIPVIEELSDFAYLIETDESAESVAVRIMNWAESDQAHRLRRQVRQLFTWQAIFSSKLMPLIQNLNSIPQGSTK